MDDEYHGPLPKPGPASQNAAAAGQVAQDTKDEPTHTPQAAVSSFWSKFNSEHPGKVFRVLPKHPYAREKAARSTAHGTVHGQKAYKSYEQAKAECIRDVDRIILECKRTNQKYRDEHFDIEWDLKTHARKCLDGILTASYVEECEEMKPKGVKRVTDVFEKPSFFINGPSAGDVRQGHDGDCYLMAALSGLGDFDGLIQKVCVKHDDECMKVGVYGFVFHRDGEWQHTIIDDKLYLKAPDYHEATAETLEIWDDISRVDSEAEYRKAHLTGSRALYFAQCSNDNETWLPLLEKAYAKAHGDFAAIDGGFMGEAIEDLTGGVTMEIYTSDILDKEAFWRDQLMQVQKEFLFGCATGFFSNWLDEPGESRERDNQGIVEKHAYSVMDAKEIPDPKTGIIQRLVKVRNPWGKKEWVGRWSDGSAEWTPEWMTLLDHKFGNDGIFWINYEDLFRRYAHFDRTRIFGPEWSVTQCWTSVDVAWMEEYHSTKFQIKLKEKTQAVIVLSQLDDRYFQGLEGPYAFTLQFRLENANAEDPDDYIVRAHEAYAMTRSVSTDIDLEAGTYNVLMKITAKRMKGRESIEDLIPIYITRKQKLVELGLSYDLAHAKGRYIESQREKEERKREEREDRREEKQEAKRVFRRDAEKKWRKDIKNSEREIKKNQRQRQKKSKSMGISIRGRANTGQSTDTVGVQAVKSFEDMDRAAQPTEPKADERTVHEARNQSISDASEMSGTSTHSQDDYSSSEGGNDSFRERYHGFEGGNGSHHEEGGSYDEDGRSHDDSCTSSRDGGSPPGSRTPRAKNIHMKQPLDGVLDPSSIGHQQGAGHQSSGGAAHLVSAAAQNTKPANDKQLPPTPPEEKPNRPSAPPLQIFPFDSDEDYPAEFDTSSSSSASSESEFSDDGFDAIYRPPSHPLSKKLNKNEGNDDERSGPDEGWNAVCVVGLRVYSTIEGGVDLKVVWPKEEKKWKGKKHRTSPNGVPVATEIQKLDPDHPAKGAVAAGKDEDEIAARFEKLSVKKN